MSDKNKNYVVINGKHYYLTLKTDNQVIHDGQIYSTKLDAHKTEITREDIQDLLFEAVKKVRGKKNLLWEVIADVQIGEDFDNPPEDTKHQIVRGIQAKFYSLLLNRFPQAIPDLDDEFFWKWSRLDSHNTYQRIISRLFYRVNEVM